MSWTVTALSRQVLNDAPELLALLADVLTLDEDVLRADRRRRRHGRPVGHPTQ
ncbi:hypothetical protein [Streptomyces albospinus]|uniref:hypothetical protein n=1 Tax=Streptomyces albospinus TaxID=285515 RepID=UPI001E37691F|nr:hypothetical protein [Streptomyces albospinus]